MYFYFIFVYLLFDFAEIIFGDRTGFHKIALLPTGLAMRSPSSTIKIFIFLIIFLTIY